MKDCATKEAGRRSQLAMEEREEIAITLEKGRSKAGIGRAIGAAVKSVSADSRSFNACPFAAGRRNKSRGGLEWKALMRAFVMKLYICLYARP
ncbi:MAG: helix-turn-helix domain-containing protein, partial [Treponema sp.]|nr:helix-turn-helix domain-containing protein [Treponema sp.]